MRFLLIGLVKAYRLLLSPYVGRSCRFDPTCSQYALDALNEYGALKGGWMAMRRIGRCHPWHPGGYDPVPHKHAHKDERAKENLRIKKPTNKKTSE